MSIALLDADAQAFEGSLVGSASPDRLLPPEPKPRRKLPLTPKRLAANRANAKKSTGPRTHEGKARSSRNAVKHGMCSSSPVLPGECSATFGTYKAELHTEFQPDNALQKLLFDQLIRSAWAMHRFADAQRELFAEEQKKANAHPTAPLRPCQLLARRFSQDSHNGFLAFDRYERFHLSRFLKLTSTLHRLKKTHPGIPYTREELEQLEEDRLRNQNRPAWTPPPSHDPAPAPPLPLNPLPNPDPAPHPTPQDDEPDDDLPFGCSKAELPYVLEHLSKLPNRGPSEPTAATRKPPPLPQNPAPDAQPPTAPAPNEVTRDVTRATEHGPLTTHHSSPPPTPLLPHSPILLLIAFSLTLIYTLLMTHNTQPLEPRLHLAGDLLADYYPLTPGSSWRYGVSEDGGARESLNVSVGSQTRIVSGETARRVSYRYADGDRVNTWQNITRRGVLHIHGGALGDDASLWFSPPVALPPELKEGQRRRTSGGIDVDIDTGDYDFHGDGDYSAVATVGGTRKITVPAGTFNARKVTITAEFDASEDVAFGAGPEVDGTLAITLWLAEGVGIVKATQAYDLDADLVVSEEQYTGTLSQSLRSYSIEPSPQALRRPAADADEDTDTRDVSEVLA